MQVIFVRKHTSSIRSRPCENDLKYSDLMSLVLYNLNLAFSLIYDWTPILSFGVVWVRLLSTIYQVSGLI
jgi:hypothetical protein